MDTSGIDTETEISQEEQTKIAADDPNLQYSKIPTYAKPINLFTSHWSISNPYILSRISLLASNIESIFLEKGVYRIDYIATIQTFSGTGLGVFDRNSGKLEELLVWYNETEKTNQICGSKYLRLRTPGLLGIGDEYGTLRPQNFDGAY